MEKPAVHRGIAEYAECAAVRIRQNRLAAEVRHDSLKAGSDLVEGFVPGDALEFSVELRSACTAEGGCTHLAVARSLRCDTPHGIKHPIRRIDAIQVLRDFRAEEPARDRMRRIASDFRGATVLDCNQNAASIGAIVGASGMDDFLHAF
jgi:hypothetical protein